MSSSISIPRTCEYCGQSFLARTLLTRYCSKQCNSRHYKEVAREQKIQVNQVIQQAVTVNINSPIQNVQATTQQYLLLDEAAVLMRISKRTLHRLIREEKIKKKKLNSRTIILRDDITNFFNNQ